METQILKYNLTHIVYRTISVLMANGTVQEIAIKLVNTQNVSVINNS